MKPARGGENVIPANGVCVLGMHRSGTSLVAGLLRHLGIDLGPEDEFLPPDSNNQSGYFELAELVHLNDEILAHYGGSWSEIPALPRGWEGSDELAQIRDRARRLLIRRFGSSPQWGWKDPRTSITLPFWQQLAPGLRYVICVRNPVDVAHSLRSREGEDRGLDEDGLDWLRHTASALAYTAGQPRALVHYERFFKDTEQEVRRLAGFLGCEDRLDEQDTMEQIAEFIDPALVHARSPTTTIADHPAMPFDVAALYLALNLVADLEARAGRTGPPEAWAGINALAGRCLPSVSSGVELGDQCRERRRAGSADPVEASDRVANPPGPEGPGYPTTRPVIKSPRGDRELEFIRDIAPRDGMKKDVPPEAYYRVGLAALACIRHALDVAGVDEPRNILDLPSGYGRVLRMLKAAFPDADLTACDVDRAAVDFCAQTFGATPAYSSEDPSDLRLAGEYDLIWCGSLLTHLGAEGWRRFLPWFERQLRDGGILVFTTHGRSIADEIRSGRREFPVRDLNALVAAYDGGGFGYEPYPNHQWDYGMSLSAPAWVCGELQRCPDLKLLMYTEQGWDGFQDAVACVKLPAHRPRRP